MATQADEPDVQAAIKELKRLALGFRHCEWTQTTIRDPDGRTIWTEQSVTEKYCPPNPDAILGYLRLVGWDEP